MVLAMPITISVIAAIHRIAVIRLPFRDSASLAIAMRSHRSKPLRDPSARFVEDWQRISNAPSAKVALQDARWRLLDVDRDQDQSVRIKQRDDGTLDLQDVVDVGQR
jgi:hypothetical protein